jgi:Tol biopolymer transport system component
VPLVSIALAATAAPADATWPGKRGLIAYSDDSIHTTGLAGTPGPALAEGGTNGLSWSPDGRRIVFGSSNGLETVAADGSDRRTVIASGLGSLLGPSASIFWPSWSPDGRRILFMLPKDGGDYGFGTIQMAHADGSGLQQIALGNDAAWAPDGRLIAVAEDDGDIVAMRPDGTRYRVLVRRRGNAALALDFAPRGRRLAYLRLGSLHTLDLRTGERTRTRSKYGHRVNAVDLAWAPNGRRIAYLHWSEAGFDEVRSVSPRGRRVKTLLRVPTENVAWSFSWQTR